MIPHPLRRLARDRRGATVIEFAIVVPVMLTLIMGLGELAYQEYVQSVLTGALQKAGRDSTIQGNGAQSATTAIDTAVMTAVWLVAKNATYASTRKSYSSFQTAGPEPFTDSNGNGVYDKGSDCFTDVNGNGVWDADPGATGQGGANDVTVYSITISYRRLFPLFSAIGLTSTASLYGTTVLKNQPWATQSAYTPVQICPK